MWFIVHLRQCFYSKTKQYCEKLQFWVCLTIHYEQIGLFNYKICMFLEAFMYLEGFRPVKICKIQNLQIQISEPKLLKMALVWRVSPSQCAGGIYSLDQKFQRPNCFFWLLWCKTSLNQPKNSSVNRLPLKIALLHRDFRKSRYKFPSFYSQKSYLEGKPVDRWIFWLIQTCFAP